MRQPLLRPDDGTRIIQAIDPIAVTTVRELFREYAAELGVDLCFQGFAAELAGLPGAYAPPLGVLLLALRDDQPVGCVGLRPLAPRVAEIKRLHVRHHVRRLGLGRTLVDAVVDHARGCGYHAVRLDTLASMTPAIRLYESFGFRRIDAYYANPIADALYFELSL